MNDKHAFPSQQFKRCSCGLNLEVTGHNAGMTLRDWFAGQALIGLLASCAHPRATGSNLENYSKSSKHAYEIADAMLEERGKEEQ